MSAEIVGWLMWNSPVGQYLLPRYFKDILSLLTCVFTHFLWVEVILNNVILCHTLSSYLSPHCL